MLEWWSPTSNAILPKCPSFDLFFCNRRECFKTRFWILAMFDARRILNQAMRCVAFAQVLTDNANAVEKLSDVLEPNVKCCIVQADILHPPVKHPEIRFSCVLSTVSVRMPTVIIFII